MGSASSRIPMLKRPRMKTLDEKENGESYEVFTTDVKEISKVGGKIKHGRERERFLSLQTLGPDFYPEHTEAKVDCKIKSCIAHCFHL